MDRDWMIGLGVWALLAVLWLLARGRAGAAKTMEPSRSGSRPRRSFFSQFDDPIITPPPARVIFDCPKCFGHLKLPVTSKHIAITCAHCSHRFDLPLGTLPEPEVSGERPLGHLATAEHEVARATHAEADYPERKPFVLDGDVGSPYAAHPVGDSPEPDATEGALGKLPRSEILRGPIIHASLPTALQVRIKLITQVLCEVFPQSFEDALDNFRRDTHPEREVQIWERLTLAYVAFGAGRALSLEGRKDAFRVLAGLMLGESEPGGGSLSPMDVIALRQLYRRPIPERSVTSPPFPA